MAQNALPPALLLIVATEPALRLRLEWLERAGYRVRTACSLKEVDQACQGQIFDVVLIADSVEPRMKKAIGHSVRHHLPEAPILQMGRIRPDLDGNEIMAILGIPPGPLVGRASTHLRELRMEAGPLGHEAAVQELLRWAASEGLSVPPSSPPPTDPAE